MIVFFHETDRRHEVIAENRVRQRTEGHKGKIKIAKGEARESKEVIKNRGAVKNREIRRS